MARKKKPIRLLMYDGKYLHLKTDGIERNLGELDTMLGRISPRNKLKAVRLKGEWIKL